MQHLGKISIEDTQLIKGLTLDYLQQKDQTAQYASYRPDPSLVPQIIEAKRAENNPRELLVETLFEQYKGLDLNCQVSDNIELLGSRNTFVVVSAHQPCLFTGPLYFIVKIASAIKACRQLKAMHPQYHFVPVHWLGTEDHDFDEINHAYLYGKKLTWEAEPSGAVGRMSTDGIEAVIDQAAEILGEGSEDLIALLRSAYAQKKYGKATMHLVHEWFKSYGLVVFDQDDKAFKQLFKHVMREELVDQVAHQYLAQYETEMEQAGYPPQAHRREINLFYLTDRQRSRIERDGDTYQTVDQVFKWSQEEVLAELDAHPERFSPNVILRPLYQQLVLPAVAFIGGPSEIAYWLQLKPLFEHFKINFPMLLLRNMVMLLNKGQRKKLEQLDLRLSDLFQSTESLIEMIVARDAQNDWTLDEQQVQLEQVFETVASQASEIDPTLAKLVAAEAAKAKNQLNHIEGKLRKAEKQKHDVSINQVKNLRGKLFPGGALHERHDNPLMYAGLSGMSLVDSMLSAFDPFESGVDVFLV